MAGRVNAGRISEAEIADKIAQHAALVLKKYEDKLSFEEERKLTYLRWDLDRIENAFHGPGLDVLEAAVSDYENFYKRLASFADDLNASKRR